jgi:hypothetical protein
MDCSLLLQDCYWRTTADDRLNCLLAHWWYILDFALLHIPSSVHNLDGICCHARSRSVYCATVAFAAYTAMDVSIAIWLVAEDSAMFSFLTFPVRFSIIHDLRSKGVALRSLQADRYCCLSVCLMNEQTRLKKWLENS